MEQSEYTIEETDLNVLVCLRLSELQNEQLGIDVTVRMTTANVTASADPVPLPANDAFCNIDVTGDYVTAETLEVEFSSASTVGAIACAPITINNDTVVEDPETFTVSIISDSLPPGINSSATSATVFIISDASDSKYNVTQQFY